MLRCSREASEDDELEPCIGAVTDRTTGTGAADMAREAADMARNQDGRVERQWRSSEGG